MVYFMFLFFIFIHMSSATWFSDIYKQFADANQNAEYLKQHVDTLTRQVMLQQFFNEQRVRSEGQSGVKLNRQRRSGSKNYFVETHNGYSAGSIHDHSNNIRTVGLGEMLAVLNGVEFQTRHNDYRLFMPHKTSKNYHATQEIPFPDVPKEVTSKKTVSEQITEMKEWFKAWQKEDHSVRDYRKYFKPVLCYLEGAWTTTGQKIDEPFKSDRHFIDATTWMELHEKLRFVAYSGSKSLLENLSYLPTKIIEIRNGIPIYAQWNYRILCHPMSKYLPVKYLQLVEDLSSRMMTGYNIYRHTQSRAARFQVASTTNDRPVSGRSLLDDLMEEIPGKDNYQAKLYDDGLDTPVLDDDGSKQKDVSRYHRWYKVNTNTGHSNIHRGFSDDYLFAAMTTQEKVAGINLTRCKDNLKKIDCKNVNQKWTYAIPLEIIYLTPLAKWNPYNLKYHGEHLKNNPATLNGRYGDCVPSKKRELNGTNSKRFYQTPDEFYSGEKDTSFVDDTSREYSCVLDQNGASRKVRASGTYVMLPPIKDIGILRQRYPIFPVHGEGSSVWKELNAFREIFMNLKKYEGMLWENENYKTFSNDTTLILETSQTDKTTPHKHYIEVTAEQLLSCRGGKEIYITTSTSNGHQHQLRIRWNPLKNIFYYYRCDGSYRCWDNHPKNLKMEE